MGLISRGMKALIEKLEEKNDELNEEIGWRDSNINSLEKTVEGLDYENHKLKEMLRKKEEESRLFYEKQELVEKERQEEFKEAFKRARQAGIIGKPKDFIKRPTTMIVDDFEQKIEDIQRDRHVKIPRKEICACLHCGEPVYYSAPDAVDVHLASNRWEGDNGYWCDKEHTASAEVPRMDIPEYNHDAFLSEMDKFFEQ